MSTGQVVKDETFLLITEFPDWWFWDDEDEDNELEDTWPNNNK